MQKARSGQAEWHRDTKNKLPKAAALTERQPAVCRHSDWTRLGGGTQSGRGGERKRQGGAEEEARGEPLSHASSALARRCPAPLVLALAITRRTPYCHSGEPNHKVAGSGTKQLWRHSK